MVTMMAYPPRLIDRFLSRFGLVNPAIVPGKPSTRKPIEPKFITPTSLLGIRTVGVEQDPTVYGALRISPQRAKEIQKEILADREKYEREISAPIESPNGIARIEFGSTMGGFGLTPPEITRAVLDWERKQVELLAPLEIGEILSTAPIKTCQN